MQGLFLFNKKLPKNLGSFLLKSCFEKYKKEFYDVKKMATISQKFRISKIWG